MQVAVMQRQTKSLPFWMTAAACQKVHALTWDVSDSLGLRMKMIWLNWLVSKLGLLCCKEPGQKEATAEEAQLIWKTLQPLLQSSESFLPGELCS